MNTTNAKTYYQDGNDQPSMTLVQGGQSVVCLPVVVESGLLRVGNDTYALAGVDDAKLKVTLESSDSYYDKDCEGQRAIACLFFVMGAFFFYSGLYWWLPCLVVTIVCAYLSVKARAKAVVARRLVARMVLSRSGTEKMVVIGFWSQHPDQGLGASMERFGYNLERARKDHVEGWRRAEAIAQAVGSAIAER